MGKYKILAITLAVFISGAMPPTISPMLNMDSITKIYVSKKPPKEPLNLQPKNKESVPKTISNDSKEYIAYIANRLEFFG